MNATRCKSATSAFLIFAAVGTADASEQRLEVHDQVDSAAAVGAAIRIEPLAGDLEVRAGRSDGSWQRDSKSGPKWTSRHDFELVYEVGSGRLAWSDSRGELLVETLANSASLREGANLLRIEVLNFDGRAAARLESLELEIGGEVRSARPFGGGAMTADLATLWEPQLARGFRLTGVLSVENPSSAAGRRLSVEFGLGRGRRVEVELEGRGGVRSVPPRLVMDATTRLTVAFFGADEAVELEAVETGGGRFLGWRQGNVELATLRIGIEPAVGLQRWTAMFKSSAEAAAGGPAEAHGVHLPDGGGFFTFSNTTAITIPGSGAVGHASPYPSQIQVGPIGGRITDLNVRLNFVSHTYPDDIDVYLVSPMVHPIAASTALRLVTDACGADDLFAQLWRFDDQAPLPLSNDDSEGCTTFVGTLDVKVSDYPPYDPEFPALLPMVSLGDFVGQNPNGFWKLYVIDDENGDTGSIGNGWTVEITTGPYEILIPAVSFGESDPYPAVRQVVYDGTTFGAILDVDVHLQGISHTFAADLDVLVVAPNGEGAIVVSDACDITDLVHFNFSFDDEAGSPLPNHVDYECFGSTSRPTDHSPADIWPAPAPPGPFAPSLALFDGDSAAGTWKLFIYDDATIDSGFLEGWTLQLTLSGVFRDGFENGSISAWELSNP